MKRPIRVLIVEDNPADAELVVRELHRAGFDPQWQRVDTEAEFLDRLHPDLDIILSDYSMPQFDGLRALELLKQGGRDVPFIFISGTLGEEKAVEAMKQGVTDYLLKDRITRLGNAVERALEQKRLRDERKRMQQQLLLQSTAVETAGSAVLVTNRSGAILWVNPAFTALTGYTAEEVLGKTPRVLKSGKHDQAFYRKVWKTILSGQTWRGEFTNRRKDGSLFYDEHTITPVRSEGGEITHFIGIMHDVTERRQAEEALRLFRTLVDQFNDTFEVIDPETARFLDVNENGCTELGYSRAEYLALRVFDIDPMVKPSAWPQFVERMRATGSLSGEGFHRRKDGTTFPIEFNAKWVRLDRDYVVTVVRDITERKRAEARVREQAEMLDHAHDAIIVRDIHTGPITFWNQGAERLYGWTAAEAVGRDIGKLIFADPSAPKAITEQLLKTGEWHGEHKHVSKAGEKLTVSSHATLVRDADGHPKSALVINIDITEQKKIEEQFLRAQRLESIGTLASGVAHDLNNILVPILMAAPLLRGDVPEEEREKFLAIVEQSAQRGASIVKQVLTFARGADGDRILLQPIYLVQEIAKIAEETFPKSVAVRTNYPEALWTIVANPTQLHQILLNLCINARDAMPTGGTLTLALENFEVDDHYASMTPGAKAGPHVLLKVSDTGTGIPREIIDKIFDPFFTTKELGQGTGLGLSTVLGIVKSHGGFMHVYGEAGHTSFKVFLPAAQGDGFSLETPSPVDIPTGKGQTILVVDDEIGIREVAEAVLSKHDYKVLLAEDGTQALAIFASHQAEIDVVMTDVAMPFIDGLTLVRTLRKMKPGIRIILSSGRDEDCAGPEVAALRVDQCLTKPYTRETLLLALDHMLNCTVPAVA